NDRNQITTYQDGDDNSLGVWGGGPDGVELGNNADDNIVDARQVGDNNDADIEILSGEFDQSTFNDIELDQLSSGNYAGISVDGNTNIINVSQSVVDGNVANVTVAGDGNTANVTQN